MRFWKLILLAFCITVVFAVAPEFNPLEDIYTEVLTERVNVARLGSEDWQAFVNNYSHNWTVLINPVDGMPKRIMGKAIMPDGFDKLNDSNIEDACMSFIREQSKILNPAESDFKLQAVHNQIGKYFVHYDQLYKGLHVFNSRISLTAMPDKGFYSFGSSFKKDIAVDVNPSLNLEDAKQFIIENMGNVYTSGSFKNNGLIVFPEAREKEYVFHLAYWLNVKLTKGQPGEWDYIIDAHTGDILQRTSTRRTFGGTITGNIKPQFYDDADTEMPFPNQRVFVDGAEYTSDGDGNWEVSGSVSSHSFETSLYGDWCDVNNEDYADASFSTTFSSDPFNYRWTSSDAYIDESTVYYHVNFIHDWYLENFNEHCMDYRMPSNVKVGDSYDNAYYSGGDGSINFGEGGSYFYNLALHCDVLYHEYTHGVTHHIYPGGALPYTGQSGALDESYSDYIPATILEESRMGLRLYRSSPSEFMRNCDNDHRYPEDYTDEVHYDDMIATGAMWDIRTELGKPHTDTLVHYARYEYPEEYEALLYAMLTVDDDDGDLTNGTPNAVVIYDAWYAHGIGPGTVLSIDHSPIADSEDETAPHTANIDVVSTVSVDIALSSLHWSNDGGSTWDESSLIEGASIWEFSAVIPPQPMGTDIHYYITIENIGGQIANDPSEGPASPYMFTIGTDTEAPQITHTEMPVQSLIVWPAVVQCDVTDNLGLRSVECEIEIDGERRATATLSQIGETSRYRGLIDTDVEVGDIVNYRIHAQDDAEAGNEAFYPVSGWYSFEVVDYYDEPFEYEYNPYSSYATADSFGNQWHTQSDRNNTSTGSIAFKCGSNSFDETYTDRLDASLESPRFNLGENSTMTFFHWNRTETSGYYEGMAYDGGFVEIKPEGGSWTQIAPEGGYPLEIRNASETGPYDTNTPCFGGDHNWEMVTFDLSAYSGPVYIRWRFGSDRAVEEEGWYIDDIHIETEYLHVVDDNSQKPEELEFAVYPNPFNSSCAIDYPMNTKSLEIVDISGRMIEKIDTERGNNTYIFSSNTLESGIYLVRINTDIETIEKKIVLLK